MPNQVHHRTKARRYNEATLLLARLASETGQEQIGRQIRVLVDAPGVARTEWDAPDIDGTVSRSSDAARRAIRHCHRNGCRCV